MAPNTLYYGDNLSVLREFIHDESVDLIYLDPPFNSRHDYNVLFAEKDGTRSSSQVMAFEDTWEWNQESMRAYDASLKILEGADNVLRSEIAGQVRGQLARGGVEQRQVGAKEFA